MGIDLDLGLVFGIAAGLLQLVGYIVYMRDDHIDPNPMTWLMFAYGTLLLTALEWDSDATLPALILPMTCGSMAVVVAGRCWWRAVRRDPSWLWPREWWPEDWRDRSAFQVDLALTACYLVAAILTLDDRIAAEMKTAAVLTFLVAANLTTFSAFFPLIRNVYENPGTERALPWAIWSAGYAMLGIATLLSQGEAWRELMLYPALNLGLHGTVAYMARRSRREATFTLRALPA